VLTYEAMKIRFADFDLSDFDPDSGKINFGSSSRSSAVPDRRGRSPLAGGMAAGRADAGGGARRGRGDARHRPGRREGGAVELQVIDPTMASAAAQPASLVIDISTKPLIALVWIGTLMVMAGIGMAIALRRLTSRRSRGS